jgi:hypothetical protein
MAAEDRMKAERLTILVTAKEKAAIHARAQRLGLSAGEMVRRAVVAYDPALEGEREESEAVLNKLADELLAAASEARAALAVANQELESTLGQLSSSREAAHGSV